MDVFAIGRFGLDAVGAVVSASLDLAAIPLRESAKILAGERSDLTGSRRSWRGAGRAWIEVRGLDDDGGADVGAAVLDALRFLPGVTSVRLNRPLSRVVVEIDFEKSEAASLTDLCAAVESVEAGFELAAAETAALPGDGLLLAAKGAMVGANAVGLAIATAGSVLRWPAAPKIFDAAASVARYQPLVRSMLESRIGPAKTDAVLSLVSLGSHVITMSPAILAVDMMVEGLKAAEARAGALAWSRYEPALARWLFSEAPHPDVHTTARPVPRPDGVAERYLKRTAVAQVFAAGAVGALTRNLDTTSNAILATSPKAVRTSCESFAATLGQGLADAHGVLPLRPDSLRRLDKIDTVLVDPRVLTGEKRRVVQIRGAGEHELPLAWKHAQALLDKPGLRPGWHRVPRMTPRGSTRKEPVDALILPAHHALASAVVLEGRGCGAELVTVDTEILGELRPGFDDIRPVLGSDDGDDVDGALAAAVADLQQAGRTVAVLSTSAAQALASADVALGVMPDDENDALPPPFHADLLLADLAGAWQVLRALPAARSATERGVAISIGASSIAGLLLVRGVRATIPGLGTGPSRGPGPVTVGAGAGMLSGYLLARRVLRAHAPKPAPAYEWHAMSVEQARELLAPDEVTPLADRAPVDAEEQGMFWPYFHAVREELSDPMTPILALCSAATAMLGSPIDAVMVGTVLTGNAMLAAYQRLRAESRLNILLAQQAPPARVVVTGLDEDSTGAHSYHEIVAEQLLPGDLIEVRSNEVVPADARVIEVADVEVDESSLTGESLSVGKQLDPTPGAELAERSSMLYAGTTVIAGKALAMVTAVGADTQARRASELASGELPEVGLQHHLSQLMYRTFPYSAAGGVAVGALGLLRQGGLRVALGNAIAVAIAAVPEGMPLMATLAQHASSQRLTKSGALVRIPRSVEALGRVDVVCFDKTGTLSENRLRVTTVRPLAGHTDDDVLGAAAQAAPAPDGAAYAHATDQAIVEGAATAAGARPWTQPDVHLPFRSGRAFSASVLGSELLVKGAPEVVLGACKNADARVERQVAEMAAQGLRVIAVAHGKLTAAKVRAVREDSDRLVEVSAAGLTLIGFLGLADTPRADAPQLLADLAARGVDIRMITGDHPITATAIAAEMGVTVGAEQVITGSEWNALNRKEQERVVCDRVIFARMSPENKVQIVQTLERAGRVSAMVGDGANDAAAIRAATVGLGVVAHGSDSAHATADVVLTDGKIGALVDAIDEGRRLWRGVQLAISGLLGGNVGEVLFSVIGTAITGNSPLNTRQLLLMNTLTDALPATAVAVSTPAGPIGGAVPGLDERKLWRAVAFRGGVTAAAGTAAWAMASVSGLTGNAQRASTVGLISLVTAELGQTVVDSRAPLVLATAAGSFVLFAAMVSTPGVSQLLGCTPVGPIGWAQGVGTAAAATAAVAVASRLPAKEISAPVKEIAAPARKAPAKKAPAARKAPAKKAPAAKKTTAKAAATKSSAKLHLVR